MPVISTNNAANAALDALNRNTVQETSDLARLASGTRIIRASDDPAGLALASEIQAGLSAYRQDSVNIRQGQSILDSADTALAQMSAVLQRMLSLAIEATSAQVSDTQRSTAVDGEYQQLIHELDVIADTSRYANQPLLAGSFLSNVSFLVGTQATDTITVTVANVDSTHLLAVNGTQVDTAAHAESALATVGSAIDSLTKERAQVGAYESRFLFSGEAIAAGLDMLSAGYSVIFDADVAQVKAQVSAGDVRTQSAVAALTQASQLPTELLSLIQASQPVAAAKPAAAEHPAAPAVEKPPAAPPVGENR